MLLPCYKITGTEYCFSDDRWWHESFIFVWQSILPQAQSNYQTQGMKTHHLLPNSTACHYKYFLRFVYNFLIVNNHQPTTDKCIISIASKHMLDEAPECTDQERQKSGQTRGLLMLGNHWCFHWQTICMYVTLDYSTVNGRRGKGCHERDRGNKKIDEGV